MILDMLTPMQRDDSRLTIYKSLRRGSLKEVSIYKSINERCFCLKYRIKRLARTEKGIEARLKAQAMRYHKDSPDQMLYLDTKRLPLLEGEICHRQEGVSHCSH